jgi:hypothetical protein
VRIHVQPDPISGQLYCMLVATLVGSPELSVHELPASRIRKVSDDESANPFTVRANGTCVLKVQALVVVGPATRPLHKGINERRRI